MARNHPDAFLKDYIDCKDWFEGKTHQRMPFNLLLINELKGKGHIVRIGASCHFLFGFIHY
jgi:hypothetical protein